MPMEQRRSRQEVKELIATVSRDRFDEMLAVFFSDRPDDEIEAWFNAQPDCEALSWALLNALATNGIGLDEEGTPAS